MRPIQGSGFFSLRQNIMKNKKKACIVCLNYGKIKANIDNKTVYYKCLCCG